MSFNASNIGKVLYTKVNGTIPVWPVIAAQSTTPPYLVYSILRNEPEGWKEGTSPVDTLTLLISCYHTTYPLASSTALLIRGIIDGVRNETVAGINLDSIIYVTESDDYEPENRLYIKTQEYTFRIQNSLNTLSPTSITVTSLTKTSNFTMSIPAGYTVARIIFNNTTDKTAQLSCGSTSSGNDIFSSQAIAGITTLDISYTPPLNADKTIYFNTSQDGDGWNAASADVYMVLLKIT